MIALSIRQPWAWLIVNGYKDIENRYWPTKYRGPCLIHAGKTMTVAEYDAAMAFIEWNVSADLVHQVPDKADLPRGGLVGIADVVDCVKWSDSPWFTGSGDELLGGFGFVLEDAKPVTFLPWKGRLGFFNLPFGETPC